MPLNTPSWAAKSFEAVPSPLPENEVISVNLHGLEYACHFRREKKSDGLLVWLWATAGVDGTRPVIKKRMAGRQLQMDTLIISDPTLLQRPDLRIGMFFGDEDHDPIDGVIEIATKCATNIGVPARDIVFVGTSSGGFAAVAAACRLGAGAITLNAPLDLPAASEAYPEGKHGRHDFRPNITSAELAREYPARSRGASAYKTIGADTLPRLAIFQNVVDRYQYQGQFLPFCSETGASPTGGRSSDGRILTDLLNYPEGHHATKEAVDYVLKTGVPFVRNDPAARGQPSADHKTVKPNSL